MANRLRQVAAFCVVFITTRRMSRLQKYGVDELGYLLIGLFKILFELPIRRLKGVDGE